MKARTKRRFKRLNKKSRIERRIKIRRNHVAYEVAVLAAAGHHEVEVWRSLRNGLWERMGKAPLDGDSRQDVIDAADRLLS